MLYNVTTMASTWHTVATKEVALLKQQMDVVNSLPKEYVFLNYLRCHDDIGWGLDYDFLKPSGIQEIPHKKYLNEYFRGMAAGSDARGELYNDDPVLQDARLCGTTASLCGLETSLQAKDPARIERAIQKILMLNAYLFIQSGIPVIYSGDEIGQLNDYSYKVIRMQTVRRIPVMYTEDISVGSWKRKEQKGVLSRTGFSRECRRWKKPALHVVRFPERLLYGPMTPITAMCCASADS